MGVKCKIWKCRYSILVKLVQTFLPDVLSVYFNNFYIVALRMSVHILYNWFTFGRHFILRLRCNKMAFRISGILFTLCGYSGIVRGGKSVYGF